MKNRYYHRFVPAVFLAAAMCFTGCKKLDEKLYTVETSDNFFQNAGEVMSAYVLPYSFIQTYVYQVHFALQEFPTDEAVVPVRYGYIDQEGAWIRLHQHTWTSTDSWILAEWQNLFQGIGYCNYFIDAIQNKDVSAMNLPVSKEQMIAEIKMVRALQYYWALSDFRNIPIVEHVGEASPATKSGAEVFAFIEKEIKDNLGKLSEKGDPGWYGHFTKSAAQALLAKLYLNAKVFTGQERWQDCIAACDAVINSDYVLDEHWNDPFLVHNEVSNENIFVVPFDASNAQQFNFIEQNFHENILFAKYGVEYYGWHKISTQESFYDLYQQNDFRINQWVVGPQTYIDDNGDEQPVTMWDGTTQMDVTPYIDMLINNDGGEAQGAMNKKYEIEYGGLESMNNDMVIFRLADILYMKAECLMRLNGDAATQDAVDLVNSVRARSFAANDPDATYTTGSLTIDELLNERGREFSYEMHRREDLIRFDKFNEEWWEKPASDKKYEIFPIPFDVSTANPALKQNPGY